MNKLLHWLFDEPEQGEDDMTVFPGWVIVALPLVILLFAIWVISGFGGTP